MRLVTIILAAMLITASAQAQEFGLSFSYFIPKNGYFSTPISPFSIRGIGVGINNFMSIETGASLYRMSGLNVMDLPFETRDAMVGPNFTIFVPVELVFTLKSNNVQFDIKGGVFGFYGFDQKINYGNMDRAMREYYQLQVVNSNLTFDNKPGYGYHAGAELTLYVTSQVGVSIECNYLVGQSALPLKGEYVGGDSNSIETVAVDYPDAKIDLTGLEFSLGLIFNSGGGGPSKKRRR